MKIFTSRLRLILLVVTQSDVYRVHDLLIFRVYNPRQTAFFAKTSNHAIGYAFERERERKERNPCSSRKDKKKKFIRLSLNSKHTNHQTHCYYQNERSRPIISIAIVSGWCINFLKNLSPQGTSEGIWHYDSHRKRKVTDSYAAAAKDERSRTITTL